MREEKDDAHDFSRMQVPFESVMLHIDSLLPQGIPFFGRDPIPESLEARWK